MAKRILILGAQGMLGTQLARIYRQAIAWDKGDVDVLDAKAFEAQLRAVAAGLDAVVNCVAFNDVDGAEDRPEAAFELNGSFPGRLAELCRKLELRLVHFSTNYVFDGRKGEYPIDVTLPAPGAQSRWKTLVRLFLAMPALLLASAFGGSGGSRNSGSLVTACAALGWFASLVRGRMPKGLRDAGAYGIGYGAQVLAYLLFVTDRYPNADPTALLAGVERPPEHPVRLVGDAHDVRRSRLTVFFRILLVLPHLYWLVLWSVVAVLVAIANWFVTLARGTPAAPLHRFLSSFVRYRLHVYAFLYLAANPFPGFTGRAGSYPLDLELPAPGRQSRWKTGFRIVLVLPAAIVDAGLGSGLFVAGVLTWFVALVKGSAPWGLRNLMAYALRYDAQVNAYGLLLTDAYPHASPLEGAATRANAFDGAA